MYLNESFILIKASSAKSQKGKDVNQMAIADVLLLHIHSTYKHCLDLLPQMMSLSEEEGLDQNISIIFDTPKDSRIYTQLFPCCPFCKNKENGSSKNVWDIFKDS